MKKMRILIVGLSILLSFGAQAWVTEWSPGFACEPVKIREISRKSVSNFVASVCADEPWPAKYSEGGAVDMNHDGIDDYMFIIPWMGCGLNANGYTAHFIVSDGKGGRMKTAVEGYCINLCDLVSVGGKIYFRHSMFFWEFEKSKHNHWVYQVFSFDTNGVMRCANAEVGSPFPAVTIFYKEPKFKQIELTPSDLKGIEKETHPKSHKYIP